MSDFEEKMTKLAQPFLSLIESERSDRAALLSHARRSNSEDSPIVQGWAARKFPGFHSDIPCAVLKIFAIQMQLAPSPSKVYAPLVNVGEALQEIRNGLPEGSREPFDKTVMKVFMSSDVETVSERLAQVFRRGSASLDYGLLMSQLRTFYFEPSKVLRQWSRAYNLSRKEEKV